jgi:hypothetical protein
VVDVTGGCLHGHRVVTVDPHADRVDVPATGP